MNNENNDKKVNLAAFIMIVVLIALFAIGWIINKPEPIVIQGSAEATEVRISGKIPGRIAGLRVKEGQKIQKGDTVVIIDSPEITAKMEQASAAQRAAASQSMKAQKGARSEIIQGAYEMWQKAEVGVEISKKSYDRIQRLYEKGVVPAQKRDEVEAQYQAAVAQAAAAKSQYEMAKNGTEFEDKMAAQAMLDRAHGAVDEVAAYMKETVLVSPISGEISDIFPKQGELVGTGAPIMSVVNLDDCWFTFNVREDLLGSMKMGAIIKVKIPALNNTEAQLKITGIKPLASYATWKATKTTGEFDAKTFEIQARPIEPIQNLRPGMSAIVLH
jgi:HlyD family secretion protein